MYTLDQVIVAAIWGVLMATVLGLVVWTRVARVAGEWQRSFGRSEGRAEVIEAIEGYVRCDFSACELCRRVPELRDLWVEVADGVLAEAQEIAVAAWERQHNDA